MSARSIFISLSYSSRMDESIINRWVSVRIININILQSCVLSCLYSNAPPPHVHFIWDSIEYSFTLVCTSS